MSKKANKKGSSKPKKVSSNSDSNAINKVEVSTKEESKETKSTKLNQTNAKKLNIKAKGFAPLKKIVKFFKDSINEVKKIVWPTPQVTFKNMSVVLVISFIVGLLVFALDAGLLAVLSKFIGVAE